MEPGQPVDLGYLGQLRLVRDAEGPIAESVVSAALTVRFRRGGERLRPAGTLHHRTLKKLFQEHAIPPWMRMRLPLVYAGEQLVAVAGVVPATAEFSGRGWRLDWTGGPPLHGFPGDRIRDL